MSEFKQRSVRLPRTATERVSWKRCIIILEHCPLASISSDKGFELLNERHKSVHARRNQDPAEWRPDVVHQCLLHIQDSALNRAGMVEVYLRTKSGVLLYVDPRLRVPRHMKLFEKMMVACFYKLKVRSTSGYLSLIKVIKNPITDHLPPNTKFIRVEKDGALVNLFDYCRTACGRPLRLRETQKVAGGEGSSTEPSGRPLRAGGNNDGSKIDVEAEHQRAKEAIKAVLSGASELKETNNKSVKREREGENIEESQEENRRQILVEKTNDPNKSDPLLAGYEKSRTFSLRSQAEELASKGVASCINIYDTDDQASLRRKAAEEAFVPFAFIIGGMSRGDVKVDYFKPNNGKEDGAVEKVEAEQYDDTVKSNDESKSLEERYLSINNIRIGNRGMSAAAVCSSILHALEEAWITSSM